MQSITWKRIKDYPNYFIGETGHIFSLNRGKILKPYVLEGYNTITLSKNGIQKGFRVPRLMLETFIGPPPSPEIQANHQDGNKNDDHISNLEWATPSENIKHLFDVLGFEGSAKGKFGKDNPSSKRVHQMKDGIIVKTWDCFKDAERAGLGFKRTGISDVVSGRQKYHRGYEWKLA